MGRKLRGVHRPPFGEGERGPHLTQSRLDYWAHSLKNPGFINFVPHIQQLLHLGWEVSRFTYRTQSRCVYASHS